MVVELHPSPIGRALPLPDRQRWEPLRAGIIGVWQYAEQEFVFHRGRLVLMGRNGAGKTKVLEVLFPFLFDARNDARRLLPGGGEGRTWLWNLLEVGKDGEPRRNRGDGIVWIEFGRRGHAGAMEFATIGARLSAVWSSRRVTIVYFLTDQRPGEGLSLTVPLVEGSERRQPASRDQLTTEIEGHGHVFDSRVSYQRAIDDRLFGLHGRFDGLMNLLISLRQPKLSEKLDLKALVDHLGNALPPVADDQIRQLADALNSLRDDDVSLERMKRALAAVGRFLDDYRVYATRQVAYAAERIKGSEEGVRQAANRLRNAEAAVERAAAEVGRLTGEIGRAEAELTVLDGRIDAHRASPEMRAAEQLERADTAARAACDDAMSLEATAREFSEEEAEAKGRLDDARADVETTCATLQAARVEAGNAAKAAAMTGPHAVYQAALDVDLGASGDEIRRAIAARDQTLGLLAAAEQKLASTRAALGAARHATDDAGEQLSDREARRDRARDELSKARAALEDKLVTWAAGLAEIAVDDGALAAALEAIDGGRHGTDVLSDLALPVRTEIASMEGVLTAGRSTITTRRRGLEAERTAVLATSIARPKGLAARPADRTGRAGAPFYEVVDFAPSLTPADAAGLEAALEAAGLLDAWVSPAGGILSETDDAAVLAGPALSGSSLADVLVPAGDAVRSDVVARVLAAIGFGERTDGPWVGTDGRFALGPLAGHLRGEAAGFIGAGAQALTRARRIAELDGAIEAAAADLAANAAEHEALVARGEQVSAELKAAPSDSSFFAARAALDAAEAAVASSAGFLERARGRQAGLVSTEAGLVSQITEGLAGLGYVAGSADVAGARETLRTYRGAVTSLSGAASGAARAAKIEEREAQTHERVARKAQLALDAHAAKAQEAGRLEAAATELRTLHGASAAEAVNRLAELRRDRVATKKHLDSAQESLRGAYETRGLVTAALEQDRHRVTEADNRRTEAAAVFARYAATPLFGLASDHVLDGDPRGWSVRRLLEAARLAISTTDRTSFEPAALNIATRNVHTRFGELQAEIGAEFGLAMDPTSEDGLLLVDAQQGDDRVPIASLATILARTIDEQQRQLDARSREILSRYLFEGVGEEIGDRIREANGLVIRMNEELSRCPTASGLRIHLRWALAPTVPTGAEVATNLLLMQTAMLNDQDRARIIEFLSSRVNDARELEESRGFSDALVEALDYRSWFAFTIEEVLPGGRHHQLNARDFPSGSGGEKAVTLHLPLFAAVAAYYTGDAAKAPRLFFLDEAFAGIDRPMRGSMMSFIVRFDLDFVITTPDDWATYAELDGTSIYQLYRDPIARGVYAHHWTWTGAELLDEEALRALDEAAG